LLQIWGHEISILCWVYSRRKVSEYDGTDFSPKALLEATDTMKSFLEFTLDHQTFYEGDDIVSDFWIDSKTPEPECRAACVSTPGCKGYTVKTEPPLKGQCYLKAEGISKIYAEKYNSGFLE